MRFLYTAIFYLAMPLVLLRLLWRAYKAPAYAKRWAERFGFFPAPNTQGRPLICVHAVSVGETIAAAPLLRALLARYPNADLMVTSTTPTGSAQLKRLFADRVLHVYLPYDLPGSVARFLNKLQPNILLIMETELWPNLLAACEKRTIPVALLNARMSPKSTRGYQKLSALSQPMFASLSCVLAQSHDDRERLLSLGVRPEACTVSGNIKFDLELNEEVQEQAKAFRSQWQGEARQRKIFLAASTHAGEDEPVLDAFKQLLTQQPEALLVLVPRHPERFADVAELVCKQGLSLQKRSDNEEVVPETQVLLGDSMGEMLAFFGAADFTFIGGSLVETGGHNMIEAAAWGRPIVTGPSCFNFAQASSLLVAAGAMVQIETTAQLAKHWQVLSQDSEAAQHMSEQGRRVAAENRGALDKMLAAVDDQLGAGQASPPAS